LGLVRYTGGSPRKLNNGWKKKKNPEERGLPRKERRRDGSKRPGDTQKKGKLDVPNKKKKAETKQPPEKGEQGKVQHWETFERELWGSKDQKRGSQQEFRATRCVKPEVG